MRKWLEAGLNIVFWLVTGWALVAGFSVTAQEMEIINGAERVRIYRDADEVIRITSCVLCAIIPFYFSLWSVGRIGPGYSRRQALGHSFLVLLLSMGLYQLGQYFIFGSLLVPPPILVLGIFSFYFAIAQAYANGLHSYRTELSRQTLMAEKRKAEMEVLRNQLRPHFLFNALNNLLSMVDRDHTPQLARAFEQLSELLRYVIDESGNGPVEVQREIDFLRHYGELQQLRFEEGELQLNFLVRGEENSQHRITPGLFLPFVENAFKHGTQPERTSTIDVEFDLRSPQHLRFSIQNDLMSGERANYRKGTGLEGARKRLNLNYPDRHQLNIQRSPLFRVELIIDTP